MRSVPHAPLPRYPLLHVVPIGDEYLVYDARTHFAILFSPEQMQVLETFLGSDEGDAQPPACNDEETWTRLVALRAVGALLPGPLTKRMDTDLESVRNTVREFDERTPTRRFILEVTERCNLRCGYCPYTIAEATGGPGRKHTSAKMTIDVAKAAVDFYFRRYTRQALTVPLERREEFVRRNPPGLGWYGGEPFLAFDVVAASHAYFETLPWSDIGVTPASRFYSVTSNLTVLRPEIEDFLIANRVHLHVSIDGPREQHDRNRVFRNGRGSYDRVVANLKRLRERDPGYFTRYVLVQSVIADTYEAEDAVALARELNGERTPGDAGFVRIEHLEQSERGLAVRNPRTRTALIQEQRQRLLRRFRDRLDGLDGSNYHTRMRSDPPFAREMLTLRKFFTINTERPQPYEVAGNLRTCPMSYDAVMVSTTGELHMCEKTDGMFVLGNVFHGRDEGAIVNRYLEFAKVLDDDACRGCWLVHLCPVCAAVAGAGGAFRKPTMQECDALRASSSIALQKFGMFATDPGLADAYAQYAAQHAEVKDVFALTGRDGQA